MKLTDNIKNLFSKMGTYLRKHTDQAIVVSILIIVTVAALLSSFLFYRFALNPKKPTDKEIGYKEVRVRTQDNIFNNITNDKKISAEEQEKVNKITGDPFKQ